MSTLLSIFLIVLLIAGVRRVYRWRIETERRCALIKHAHKTSNQQSLAWEKADPRDIRRERLYKPIKDAPSYTHYIANKNNR